MSIWMQAFALLGTGTVNVVFQHHDVAALRYEKKTPSLDYTLVLRFEPEHRGFTPACCAHFSDCSFAVLCHETGAERGMAP